jgi:hypothetical protein
MSEKKKSGKKSKAEPRMFKEKNIGTLKLSLGTGDSPGQLRIEKTKLSAGNSLLASIVKSVGLAGNSALERVRLKLKSEKGLSMYGGFKAANQAKREAEKDNAKTKEPNRAAKLAAIRGQLIAGLYPGQDLESKNKNMILAAVCEEIYKKAHTDKRLKVDS